MGGFLLGSDQRTAGNLPGRCCVPVAAMSEVFPLAAANETLHWVRRGKSPGSAVLSVASASGWHQQAPEPTRILRQ